MRREQLQRVPLIERAGMRSLPRRLVFDDRRPLGIVEALEAVALEFELAGLGLQPAQILLGVVRRQRLRLGYVLLPVFPEPAERHRRAQFLLFRRHHVITALEELLPRADLWQI